MKNRFIFALLCLVASVFAASSGRDPAVEAKIEQELAALSPAAVQPFHEARIAIDENHYDQAVPLLRRVLALAPNFDAAMRRLGSALIETGHRDEGMPLIEAAVHQKRSSANLSTLAFALVRATKGEPSHGDLVHAAELLREARNLPDGRDVSTLMISVQVAMMLQNYDEARALMPELQRVAPDQAATHFFAAYLAANEEHWVAANREMKRAQALGIDANAAQTFLDSGVHSRAVAWTCIGVLAWVIAVWVGGLLLLCATGFVLSRATLRQIESSDPTVPITPGEHRLRRIYRAVLNVAGLYYYVSLPIVMLLVIGVAAGLIYAMLAAGWIAIKLVIILVIGAIATIGSMGRSLFIRVKAEDPGRALSRDEAPGMWALAEDVAATLNTRPVDEIRITPGTDLCVYERGSWRQKMEGQAHRILVIGAAVLNDFKQQDFRCVLAHEYGHFAHRDTAGGDVALRVRNDIWKFYLAMRAAGQATVMNVAFHFLRLYHFIFRRISHGATRLQEVLADRVAAQAYGAAAFEGGLRHAIRRDIEFHKHADLEIKAALEAKRPLLNLYESTAAASDTVEREYEQALNRGTTDDDTHPAPKDRFRLIARVPAPTHPAATGYVWDLFKDPAAIQREMTETIEKRIASHRH